MATSNLLFAPPPGPPPSGTPAAASRAPVQIKITPESLADLRAATAELYKQIETIRTKPFADILQEKKTQIAHIVEMRRLTKKERNAEEAMKAQETELMDQLARALAVIVNINEKKDMNPLIRILKELDIKKLSDSEALVGMNRRNLPEPILIGIRSIQESDYKHLKEQLEYLKESIPALTFILQTHLSAENMAAVREGLARA
jgi:hypothetical protein